MIEIPPNILNRLICVQCGGYLSNGPVVANNKNEQVCGRCFKILPESSKVLYTRQIAFEAVAETLIFPCRYNNQGCTHLSLYNKNIEHESSCRFRYNNLCAVYATNNNNHDKLSTNISEQVDVKVQCKSMSTANDHSDKIVLNINLVGKNGHNLQLSNKPHADNLELALQIGISQEDEPQVVYSHLHVDKAEEHVYERISYVCPSSTCVNCNKCIFKSEIFLCFFGHKLCKLCKANSCKICRLIPNSPSQHYCKNYRRGCTELFKTADISRHQIDCKFNQFKCPLCEFCDSLPLLNRHFVERHDCVILTNELNAMLSCKDQQWYFFYNDSLFQCKYYNFFDSIEFVVCYIGSNDDASNYKYSITLIENGKSTTKTGTCLGWNGASLGKAASFNLSNDLPRNKLQAHVQIT